MLAVMKRVLGAEHANTPTAAGNQASSFLAHGKHAPAKKVGLQGAGAAGAAAGATAEKPATCMPRGSGQQRARAHAMTRPRLSGGRVGKH